MTDSKEPKESAGESPENPYFSLQADWGISKHFGGRTATRELADMCYVGAGSRVLVVGCGTGVTTSFLAEHYGSTVTGIDISPGMVQRAGERVRQRQLQELVDIRQADATALPFADAAFDVVICESVNAFIPERDPAMREYYRVLTPGGYLGINECVWLHEPPSSLRKYIARIMNAEFPTVNGAGWDEPVARGGFEIAFVATRRTTIWRQWHEELRQTDLRDFGRAWGRMLFSCPRDPSCRRFVRDTLRMPPAVFGFLKYFGYQLCVGRKTEEQRETCS